MTYVVPAGRPHDLAQPDTDALPLHTMLRLQPQLEDRDDLRQHLLPQLPHDVTERTRRPLANSRASPSKPTGVTERTRRHPANSRASPSKLTGVTERTRRHPANSSTSPSKLTDVNEQTHKCHRAYAPPTGKLTSIAEGQSEGVSREGWEG